MTYKDWVDEAGIMLPMSGIQKISALYLPDVKVEIEVEAED